MPLRDDAQSAARCCRRWQRRIAPGDGAKARNGLARFHKGRVASADAAPRRDQVASGGGELLEGGVAAVEIGIRDARAWTILVCSSASSTSAASMLSSTERICVATSYAAFSIICLRMTAPLPGAMRRGGCRSDPIVGWCLAAKQPERLSSPARYMPAENAAPIAMAAIQTASGRRSSHSGGCSWLRSAVAGSRRVTARCSVRKPALLSPLHGQRAEFETDRPVGMTAGVLALNVRRLMYQSLIWAAVLGNEARRLAAALDAQDMERAANALVDRARRNSQLGRDLLRGVVRVDQPQAVELARSF